MGWKGFVIVVQDFGEVIPKVLYTVWVPLPKQDIVALEVVQKRFTRLGERFFLLRETK